MQTMLKITLSALFVFALGLGAGSLFQARGLPAAPPVAAPAAATAPAAAATPAPVAASPVVASIDKPTGPFHRFDCEWAKKLGFKNRRVYDSRAEAIKAGHVPCKVCQP